MPRWSSGAAVPLVLLSVLFVPSAAAADVTSTVVTGPTTQVVHGQSATFAATVTNTTAPASIPTGAVQLYLNGAPAGPPIALSATGTAPLQTPPLQRGDYAVRAAYLGGPGFEPSAGTTTMSVTRAATTTKVVLTPSTGAVAGEGIGFEVQVEPTTPALGTPTGTVTLLAFGTPLLQGPLGLDGFVRGELELPAVSATAVIAYSGDNAYAESETSVAVTVNKAGTVVVLSASPTTATVGQPVTFTALVDSLAPSMWWPSGQLTGAAIPGALTVDGSGTPRTFSQAFSTPGVHRVTVHFTGDEDFLASDAGLDVTVTGPPAAAPRPTAVTPRGLSVKATPKRDRRAPYRFAISGQVQLPSGAAPADAAQGKVTVDATVKGNRVARKIATVDRAGRYKTTITLRRKGSAKITAKFAGNARVTAVTARAVTVRAG